MQTTAVMVGVAAGSGNALVGTGTSFVGKASETVAQDFNRLKPDVVATDITHVLSDGSRIAADHATSITSLVKNGETVVTENISHLISNEHAISPGHLVPDIAKNAIHTVVDNTSATTDSTIGATKAAVTENATKLAQALDSANTLHLPIMPSGSQDARVCVIMSCMLSCHVSNSLLKQAFSGKQAKENISQVVSGEHVISPGHLVPDIAKNVVHTVVDNTSIVTDTAIGATKVALTENTAKLTHVLGSVNPLHLHNTPTGSEPKDAQAQVCVFLLCILSCHGCLEALAETIFVGKQAISASEPLDPHNANSDIRAVVGTAHAVADADAGTHLAKKPLDMVSGRDVSFLRLRIM
jgi:hypothetical protein